MKKLDHIYKAQLTFRDFFIPAGEEWAWRLPGWSVIQIRKGSGYYLQPQLSLELETGSVLLIAAGIKGHIRASQLGEMSFHAFSVQPERLTGLITFVEQGLLKLAASRKENAIQIMPPDSPAAVKMEELRVCPKRDGLLFRLKLVQLFVEIIGHELERTLPEEDASDTKRRLHLFLKETPLAELLEMNYKELAQRTGCTSRHLGRIFQELVGMSFRDKRTAIRLERAKELLATTDSKIVDVAMESGFNSLSLFNLTFARHFGFSPGKWRQKQGIFSDLERNEKAKSLSSGNDLLLSPPVKMPLCAGKQDEKVPGQMRRKQNGATVPAKGIRRFSITA